MTKPKKAIQPVEAEATDTTATTVPALIALKSLYPHPMNTRAQVPTEAEIAELADSIRACGLMQNLMGYHDPDTPDRIGIVAGNRRLAALRVIHGENSDALIPVVNTHDAETARAWAGAENTARRNLHPADEIRAYGRMAYAGATPNAIARAFAVTERHVQGRLRLSQLPDAAIDALRRGDITLDQAAALTVAPTEDALMSVLRMICNGTEWNRRHYDGAYIRRQLLPEAVPADSRKAVFAGLDLYEAAGGRVQRDLFTSDTRLLDPQILDLAFDQRIQDKINELKAKGWMDARCFADAYPDWQATAKLIRVDRIPGALSEAEAEEMDALAAVGDADEMTDEQAARYDELEAMLEGDWSPEDRATSTLWFYIDRDGRLMIRGAFRDAKSAKAQGESANAAPEQATAKVEKIPDSLKEDLARVMTLAVQSHIARDWDLCLDLLALTLTDTELSPWSRPLALSPTPQPITPEKPEGTKQIVELLDAPPDSTQAWRGELSIAKLDAIRAKTHQRDLKLMAALARTFSRSNTPFGHALAQRLHVNPRDVWTPTAEGYFSRLPVAMLDRLWIDLTGDLGGTFLGQKKAAKAQDLHRLFNETAAMAQGLSLSPDQIEAIRTWLPPELATAVQPEEARA